jgi:hypothetical protein
MVYGPRKVTGSSFGSRPRKFRLRFELAEQASDHHSLRYCKSRWRSFVTLSIRGARWPGQMKLASSRRQRTAEARAAVKSGVTGLAIKRRRFATTASPSPQNKVTVGLCTYATRLSVWPGVVITAKAPFNAFPVRYKMIGGHSFRRSFFE